MDKQLIEAVTRELFSNPQVRTVLESALQGAIANALRRECGGTRVYVAKTLSTEQRLTRDCAIRADWRGNNLRELASKYDVSARHIRRIVAGRSANADACTK